MKKITIELLKGINACDTGLTWFKERFPDGGTWDEVVAELQADRRLAWVSWLGHLCPAGVEGATWEARLALQRNDGERAWLGRLCPAGVEGATWEARLALQREDEERALFGRLCPAGVEGDPR